MSEDDAADFDGIETIHSDQKTQAEIALLVGPPTETVLNDGCLDALSVTSDGGANILLVTYVETPDKLITRLTRDHGSLPSNLGIIAVGESTRSTTAQSGTQQTSTSGILTAVESPTNLSGLGIAIGTYLEEWKETDGPTMVCFNSLTALLQDIGVKTAFKFIYLLRHRLAKADATAHFHLDPTAHRDQTIVLLSEVFDTTIEPDPERRESRTRDRETFSPEDINTILNKPRRMRILRFLLDEGGPMPVRELAERIAHAYYASATDEDIERMYIALVHNHLPLLTHHGLVATYDNSSHVEALERAQEFVSLIDSYTNTRSQLEDNSDHDEDTHE